MSEEIKIITLGDIFDNIETEEKAFKFKDYINDLQQKVERLEKENKILKENAEHNDKVVDKVNWENMLLKGKINKDLDKFNDELNTFKWLENDFKEHSIHYYQLECLVEYLKQLKENNKLDQRLNMLKRKHRYNSLYGLSVTNTIRNRTINNIINKDLDKFNDVLNTFKWLENDFKEHSIHYYQLECLVKYLNQLKEEK